MTGFSSQWQPLQHYAQISLIDITPGIYIWGFKQEDNFMPYYVGKAWNVADRLCTHLCNLKGGSYTIYTWNNLFNETEDNRFYEPDSIEKRIAFVTGKYHNENYEVSLKLIDQVNKMIENFYFTYVSMNNKEFSEYGKTAESTVLDKLKSIIINSRIGTGLDNFDIGNLEFDGIKYLKIV